MKIFLIGLPGSGKTTIGKELSRKLAIPFVDLDNAIETQEGRNIQTIFKTYGETFFRRLESAKLKELCNAEKDFVMATGGGAPCFYGNMDLINKSGTSIFLDIPTLEIAKRVKNSMLNKRPLFENLHDEELKDKIEFLRSQRIGFYQKAQHRISGNKILLTDLLSLVTRA